MLKKRKNTKNDDSVSQRHIEPERIIIMSFQLDDKKIHNNIILTDDVQLSLNTAQTSKNLNVCVVGGGGYGKTWNYVLPNILQANTSYVITDRDGYLLKKTGKFLKEQGYIIKVLNLNDTEHSNHYKPFDYVCDKNGICNEAAVTRMVDTLLTVPKTGTDKAFLLKQITNDIMCVLISAICFYLIEMESKENRNFKNVIRLLNMPVSELDKIFLMPDAKVKFLYLKRYMVFRKSAKTEERAEAIRIAALNRLSMFTQTDITNLTQYDDMELNLIGDRKTAIFINVSMSSISYNGLSDVLITQIFNVLYDMAGLFPNNKLPVHVRLMLDEFPNSVYIPDLEKHMAICVHKNISVNIILQCIEQLQTLYSYWDIILNNCDSILFLGGRSIGTLKRLSELTGISVERLFTLHADECVLNIRGLPPFYGKKFDVENHINYDKIED